MNLLAVHPTVKPVAMIADALRDVTRRGDVVRCLSGIGVDLDRGGRNRSRLRRR
jgi:hypothetical protein